MGIEVILEECNEGEIPDFVEAIFQAKTLPLGLGSDADDVSRLELDNRRITVFVNDSVEGPEKYCYSVNDPFVKDGYEGYMEIYYFKDGELISIGSEIFDDLFFKIKKHDEYRRNTSISLN